jgi:hypothetical protein
MANFTQWVSHGNEMVLVELTVDENDLAVTLGRKAAGSRGGKAQLAYGQVKAKIIERR